MARMWRRTLGRIGLGLLAACGLAACGLAPPGAPPLAAPGLSLVTLVPTGDVAGIDGLCATVENAWSQDWARAIDALEQLAAQVADCGPERSTAAQLYAAYYNAGAALETNGERAAAIGRYREALALNPDRGEAVDALRRLDAYQPAPLALCSDDEAAAALDGLPPYEPALQGDFIQVTGSRFTLSGVDYRVHGINYYPLNAPWRRFLTEANLDAVTRELDLLHDAGFNMLRLFVWHGALFTCPGSGAIPVPEAFARLDAIIHLASARGFRLIVTLNDLPDLTDYPLYNSPAHSVAQTRFLVERYRAEAAILAWDLRNEGDIDYEAVGGHGGAFPRETVLTWLARTAAAVRALDANHLITAGWLRDETATLPYVDFVSFHHWDDALRLRARVALLASATAKPILLEEVGYSTYGLDEAQQAAFLRDALQAAEFDGVVGWLIWTAFDFPLEATCLPPDCPSQDSLEHHFGLWRVDYSPKPALTSVRVLMANAGLRDDQEGGGE